jgi:hypothetical protein
MHASAWLASINVTDLNSVVAGQQQTPEFAVFGRLERGISTFDFHGHILQRTSVGVQDETTNAPVSLAQKAHQWLWPKCQQKF